MNKPTQELIEAQLAFWGSEIGKRVLEESSGSSNWRQFGQWVYDLQYKALILLSTGIPIEEFHDVIDHSVPILSTGQMMDAIEDEGYKSIEIYTSSRSSTCRIEKDDCKAICRDRPSRELALFVCYKTVMEQKFGGK